MVAVLLSVLPALASADDEGLTFDQVKATSLGFDFTNLWWNPAESGWGLNITHQGSILFATLFVYGADGRPLWLVGPAFNLATSGSDIVGSSSLLQLTGPPHTGAFNPGAVGNVTVGTMTIRFLGASSYRAARVTYTYNGTTVTKDVVPQVWAATNLSGTYIGGSFGATATCGGPAVSGSTTLTWTITHTGNTATINSSSGCTMTGTVTQAGKHSALYGNFTCPGGSSGQFGLESLEVGLWGLTGLYVSVNSAACSGKVATIGMARSQ